MAEVRPWLPADTRPPPALQAWLAETVDAWSRHWFATAPMTLAPLAREVHSELAWRGLPCGLMLGSGVETPQNVGARMLGVAADDRAAPDRALLEAVAEDALADLRDRLARRVEAKSAADWRPLGRVPGWAATIGGADVSLAIAITDALFARLVARVLPVPATVVLGSGAEALAAVDVRVGAAVGRADVTVADLRALEIGDVVVLSHALADPVPIAIDGRALAHGSARVVATEPQPILEIVQAATPA